MWSDSKHGHRLLDIIIDRTHFKEIIRDQTYYKEGSGHTGKATLNKTRTLINGYQVSFTDKDKDYRYNPVTKESNVYPFPKIHKSSEIPGATFEQKMPTRKNTKTLRTSRWDRLLLGHKTQQNNWVTSWIYSQNTSPY